MYQYEMFFSSRMENNPKNDSYIHNVNTAPPHPQPFSLREKGESSLSFWERAGVREKIWPFKKLLQKHYFQLPFLG
jgi:hypothetical protein